MINKTVLLSFGLDPKNYSITPSEIGHINKSFQLIDNQKNDANFFLQKINPTPFTSIDEVMKNIEHTLLYQKSTYIKNSTHLELIHTTKNNTYLTDSNGDFWRLYKNLDDFNIINPTDSEDNIYRMGLAYGGFIQQMQSADPKDIFITIPHFHNIKHRMLFLQKSIANNSFDRLKHVLFKQE